MNLVAERAPARTRDPEGTREAILTAAVEEIHRQGYRSASMETILDKAGVTKGALYHHFGSKRGLGYAALEAVRSWVLERYLHPVEAADDPVQAQIDIIKDLGQKLSPAMLQGGCPLNNLAQEMSAVDEDFRRRIAAIFGSWRDGLAEAFRRGQEGGKVRKDIDPEDIAAFTVASFEGIIGLSKTSRDIGVAMSCGCGFISYLQSLRP